MRVARHRRAQRLALFDELHERLVDFARAGLGADIRVARAERRDAIVRLRRMLDVAELLVQVGDEHVVARSGDLGFEDLQLVRQVVDDRYGNLRIFGSVTVIGISSDVNETFALISPPRRARSFFVRWRSPPTRSSSVLLCKKSGISAGAIADEDGSPFGSSEPVLA